MTDKPNSSSDSLYSPEATQALAKQWTKTMWNGLVWKGVRWMGAPIQQWPTDLIILQELIHRLRPRVIIESGVFLGGSSMFYASMLELVKIEGRVISLDLQIHPEARANIGSFIYEDKITLVECDSKAAETHKLLNDLLAGESNVLVCLDSDHSYSHTLAELRAFARYVPVGGYMIMFDTVCEWLADVPHGDPSWAEDNPMRAVRDFLASQPADGPQFVIDKDCEKLMVTFCPNGYLRRVR
jgi:cephalosporin hydroxylase